MMPSNNTVTHYVPLYKVQKSTETYFKCSIDVPLINIEEWSLGNLSLHVCSTQNLWKVFYFDHRVKKIIYTQKSNINLY